MAGPGTEVANLFTTLSQADDAFLSACEADATALEAVAAAAEETTATVTAGAAEQAEAVEASATEQAVATEASAGRMATAWSNFATGVKSKVAAVGTQVQTGFQQIGKGIEKEAGTAEQAWSKVTDIGKISALALAGIAAESVKTAMDFQSEMEMVHTQAGAAQSEVNALSGSVLNLASAVGQSPEVLAEGLYHVESAGFRGSQALDMVTASAKLASIGQSDLETTTQAVVGVMASQIKGVKDAADAGNLLNTTVGIGDMRMQQLAEAIGTGILPKAASVGLSFEDVGSALATLTDNVTPANEAATRLGMTFSMMAAPTDKAKAAYESIGMSSVQLANDLRSKGIVGALQDLQTHLNATYPPSKALKLSLQEQQAELGAYSQSLTDAGVPVDQQTTLLKAYQTQLEQSGSAAVKQSAALSAMFGGGKSSGTMLTLLGEMPRLQDKMTQYGTATSRAAQMQDAWASTQATVKQQMHEVGAQVQVLGVKIGTFLLPAVSKVFGFFVAHQSALKVFFAVIVAGMLAFTAAVIANTVAALANPIVWIVIGIVAAITLLVIAGYELIKHWSTVWGGIKSVALTVGHALEAAWNATVHALAVAAGWVKTEVIDPIVRFFMAYLWPVLKGFFAVFAWIFKFWFGFASVIVGDFVRNWHSAWQQITAIATWAYQNVIKPVADFIVQYVVAPIVAGVQFLAKLWLQEWHDITAIAKWAYDNILKPTGDFIVKWVIQPIIDAVQFLGKVWATIWGGVESVLTTVWGKIKPILDTIGNTLSSVGKGIEGIVNSPGKAGQWVAHVLGFDQGGWVPGSAGAPMLAVVHGGEFVVSRDMLAGRAATPIRTSAAGSLGSTQPGAQIIQNHVHVYLDSQEMYGATIASAGRNKLRNATTGVN